MALPAVGGYFRGPLNTGDSSLASGTALTSMVVRLFSDFQDYLDPDDTPFTSSVKTGKVVNQKKVEWLNRFLAAHTVTLNTNYVAGGTLVVLAAGDGAKVMVTDLIRFPDNGEIMWVTAISGDTLTVQFAMGGTTNANHTAAGLAAIDILGPAAQENASSPITPVAKGSLEWNYPQLMDYAIQVSNREDVTPDYEFNTGSKYDSYLEQVMIDANIDFEKIAILGKRGVENSMVVGTGKPTLMGGLDFFTDSATDLAGTAITERSFTDSLRTLYARVKSGKLPNKWYMGAFMKQAVSSIWNATRYSTVKDEETTLIWRAVDTDFGRVEFVLSRYMPTGSAYGVNLKDISKHFYKNGQWAEVMLPADGPFKKGRFTGDLTMVFLNNSARHKIINASTTATDYANF